MEKVVLIKYGELTTKKGNRKFFINTLYQNLQKKLKFINLLWQEVLLKRKLV